MLKNLKDRFEREGVSRYECKHPDYPRWITIREATIDKIVWCCTVGVLVVLLLSLTIGEYLFRKV